MLNIIQLPVLENNYIHILHEPDSGITAVVDPALAPPVLAILAERQWALDYILNTHHHWDHIGANNDLKDATGCQIAASVFDQRRIPQVDIPLQEGQSLKLGGLTLDIIDTPGHTLGHIMYYCPEEHTLFCGDTLFSLGCGRLFEGTPEQLWQSLQKIKALPEQTQIYCAHEYTQYNGQFALSVDPDNLQLRQRMEHINRLRKQGLATIPCSLREELATNPFLRADNLLLQQQIKMQDQPELAVFTQLRRLKDAY